MWSAIDMDIQQDKDKRERQKPFEGRVEGEAKILREVKSVKAFSEFSGLAFLIALILSVVILVPKQKTEECFQISFHSAGERFATS